MTDRLGLCPNAINACMHERLMKWQVDSMQ